MTAPVRRNDPCPCGSGVRFKECHGRIDAGADQGAAGVDALVQRALQMHRQGRVDEARRLYRQVLARDPGNAIATHYLGLAAWHSGDLAEAERLMRAALEADAAIPDFHNNLGLLLRDTGRRDEAIACFGKALEVDPAWFEAYNNLGLTLEAANRWDEACAAYGEAIRREPRFAAARQNLGRAQLTVGRYRDGWENYRWRLLAQGVVAGAPEAARDRLPASLAGWRIALRAEQGIGDVLFFLRFAPELARRGARLAFRGDARLHPLLARTGLFALGLEGDGASTADLEPVFVGDLPWLLAVEEPGSFPPPLRLEPLADRVGRLRDMLRATGDGPAVGLTWRAGTVAPGPVRTQLKELAPGALGERLRGRSARWVSVQRQPGAGEREALEKALGAPVHDASDANADLDEILAWMSVLDGYVGVSSFNTHLRAGLALPMQVLVPFPPEWRWGLAGERSPWFPAMTIVRQNPDGTWP
jgi:tetratricopeptide (TPR) repeat protein